MYKTIEKPSKASVKIQRSEFIAFLYPVDDTSQIKELLALHNEKYRDATHNCYAYIIGKKQENQYYSDQGEPSGTAGKPILNALLKHGMTNTLAVVTRYFGGVKLGVRGLINAYSEAVEAVIAQSVLVEYLPITNLTVRCDYHSLAELKHYLRSYEVIITPLEFGEMITVNLAVPQTVLTEVQDILDKLRNLINICLISNYTENK